MPTAPDSTGSVPWLGLIFGFVGLVMLIVTGAVGANTISFVNASTVTSGTVVENEGQVDCSPRDEPCSTSYHPVVVFTTAAGEEIRFTSDTGSGTPLYEVGDPVQVRYLTDRPQDAEIDGFVELWLGTLISSVFAVVFSPIGAGLLVGHVRATRSARRS